MALARFGRAAVLATGSALVASLLLCAPAARAEGLLRDSDDYNCNHGPVAAAGTLVACERLRGVSLSPAEVAAAREAGRQRDSDDFNCHHGPRGEARTIAACARLRGA